VPGFAGFVPVPGFAASAGGFVVVPGFEPVPGFVASDGGFAVVPGFEPVPGFAVSDGGFVVVPGFAVSDGGFVVAPGFVLTSDCFSLVSSGMPGNSLGSMSGQPVIIKKTTVDNIKRHRVVLRRRPKLTKIIIYKI
jgi:hypothetical protein